MNFPGVPPFGSREYDEWYEQRCSQRPVYQAPTGAFDEYLARISQITLIMVAESPIIVTIHRLLLDSDADLSEVSGPGPTLTANASTTIRWGGPVRPPRGGNRGPDGPGDLIRPPSNPCEEPRFHPYGLVGDGPNGEWLTGAEMEELEQTGRVAGRVFDGTGPFGHLGPFSGTEDSATTGLCVVQSAA